MPSCLPIHWLLTVPNTTSALWHPRANFSSVSWWNNAVILYIGWPPKPVVFLSRITILDDNMVGLDTLEEHCGQTWTAPLKIRCPNQNKSPFEEDSLFSPTMIYYNFQLLTIYYIFHIFLFQQGWLRACFMLGTDRAGAFGFLQTGIRSLDADTCHAEGWDVGGVSDMD